MFPKDKFLYSSRDGLRHYVFSLLIPIIAIACLLTRPTASRTPTTSARHVIAKTLAGETTSTPPISHAIEEIRPSAVSSDSGFIAPIYIEDHTRSSSRSRATSHPHGEQMCASGCALSRHPTPKLSEDAFRELLVAYSRETFDRESAALNELIFFGSQTAQLLKSFTGDLPAQHALFLKRSLALQNFRVELRVVDELGVVRVALPPTSVPQHVRQEFAMKVNDFPPAVTSGTIKRVGLNHVWQRL